MIGLGAENKQETVYVLEKLVRVVDNIGYLAQYQVYMDHGVLEKLASEQGCKRLRAVLAVTDIGDIAKKYGHLMQNGFVPIDVILGGIYVLEKKIN